MAFVYMLFFKKRIFSIHHWLFLIKHLTKTTFSCKHGQPAKYLPNWVVSMSTVSVFWRCATFWWSAIISLRQEMIYSVDVVECNHLAQTRNYIFGRCGVVECFQFHPELVLNILRDLNFKWTVWYFIYCTALYTVFFFFCTFHFLIV